MAFNRKVTKSGVVRRFYRCSRYANSGSKSCSMHTIDADTLESIILSDIQHYAQTALLDEDGLTERLLSFSGREHRNEKAAQEKELLDAKSRITFIEGASKRLFEEKISGNVPESLFKKMLTDYERELSALEEKYGNLRACVQEAGSRETDVQSWIELIKECLFIKRLDRATAYRLIDNVAIHEQTDKYGQKNQSIRVKYNFVGCIS